MLKQNKPGQATIVLIVVTMMTVLGVAVASSSQSRINLRDTVYSTQTVQALSCAEAGADRALISGYVQDNTQQNLGGTPYTLSSDNGTYKVEGCEGYNVSIGSYPASSGDAVTVPNIPKDTVQEFRTGFAGTHQIKFRSNNPGTNAGLAIYKYYGSPPSSYFVKRYMVYCNVPANGGTTPNDFQNITPNGINDITLNDGSVADNVCSYDVPFTEIGQAVIRIRPIFADSLVQITDYQAQTGFKITSTGISGQVQRDITIYKFFSQLNGVFDEAIVADDEIVGN